MDLFTAAVNTLLEVEGGYVNNPADPGGETNWGISKRSYPTLDIKNLTRETAINIYRRDYWNKIPADLPDDVRWFAFDAAVNHGVSRALRWLDGNPTLCELLATRLRFYASLSTWPNFGKGWVRRVAHVLEAINEYDRGVEIGTATGLKLCNLSLLDRYKVFGALSGEVTLKGEWRVAITPSAVEVSR